MKKALVSIVYLSLIITISGCNKSKKVSEEWNKCLQDVNKHFQPTYVMYMIIVRRSKVATPKDSFDTSSMIDTALIKMKYAIKNIMAIKVSNDEAKKLPHLFSEAIKGMMAIIKELQVYLDEGQKPDFNNKKVKAAVKKFKDAHMNAQKYAESVRTKYGLVYKNCKR